MENLSSNTTQEWFLRTADEHEYGPATLDTITQWCREARIGPDQMISADREQWTSVTDMPELEFDWILVLADGTEAGPFHLAMLQEHAHSGDIPADAFCRNRYTNESNAIHSLLPAPPSAEPSPEPPDAPETADSDQIHQASRNVAQAESATPQAAPPLQNEPTDPEDELPASERMETLSRQLATARDQVKDTRAEIQTLRSENSLLQDQTDILQERLEMAEQARTEAETQLLQMESQTAQNAAELENLRAQMEQLQEHYEKLQLENQRQFEQIDTLRSSSMTAEQAWKREISILKSRLETKQRTIKEIAEIIAIDMPDQLPHSTAQERAPQQITIQPTQPRPTIGAESPTAKSETTTRKSPTQPRPQAMPPPTPRGKRNKTPIRLITMIAIITLLAVGGWKISGCINRETEGTAQPATAPNAENTGTSHAPANLEIPDESVSLQPERPTRPVPPSATDQQKQWPQLSLARGTIQQEQKAIRIVFQYGLFSTGTQLQDQAREDLRALAEQLQNQLDDYNIVIEGHTDATPVRTGNNQFVDNFSLGLARAEVVKQFLVTQGNLPAARIHTASAGQSAPPYPNDTPENSARNRTVSISLIPE